MVAHGDRVANRDIVARRDIVAHRDMVGTQEHVGRHVQDVRTFPKRRSHAYDEINSLWSPWSLVDVYKATAKGHTMPVRVHRHDNDDGMWSSLESVDMICSPNDTKTVVRHSREKKDHASCHVPKSRCTENLARALEVYCSMRETW